MAYPTSVTVGIDMTHGPFDASFTFVDVTAYVTGNVHYEWGRSNILDSVQPSRGSFTLDNSDGRFDPSNASGPYYGNLKPRRRVRIETVVSGITYDVAWGFIEGWPLRWDGRKKCYVDITFTDSLAMFAQMHMPESVWDWRMLTTTPYLWYKLGDTDVPTAADSSGNNLTGEWRVFEGVGSPLSGNFMPKPVLAAGKTASVIPGVKRQSVSWAKMQAEVGQPLGGITGTPRSPVFVPAWDTQNIVSSNFSAAAWVLFRQAFPVSANSVYASTTPMDQPLFTWGQQGGHYWQCFLNTDGKVDWSFSIDGVTVLGLTPSGNSLDDGLPHFVCVVRLSNTITVYVDGSSVYSFSVATVLPAPLSPCVVNYASDAPLGQQSTIGDVAFWDYNLTSTQVNQLYYAGQYGSTTIPTQVLTTDQAFIQSFPVMGLSASLFSCTFGDGLTVSPTISGATFADYLQKVASSEQGFLFFNRDGTVTLHGREWVLRTNAANVQYTLGDQSGATVGYSDMDFRDAATEIQNDVTVNWPGGSSFAQNTSSITTYGTGSGSVDTFLKDPLDAQQVANFRVWKYGTAPAGGIIPNSIVVEPNTNAEWTMVSKLTLTDRLQITRTRPNGTTIVDDYWCQSVRHDFEAGLGGAWRTTIGLMPASEPANPFILDTSVLDGSDVFWI